MFVATIKDADDRTGSKLYTDYSQFYADTFSPDTEILGIVSLVIAGRTCAQRRERFREAAQKVLELSPGSLSWEDHGFLHDWIYTNAKKFGFTLLDLTAAQC